MVDLPRKLAVRFAEEILSDAQHVAQVFGRPPPKRVPGLPPKTVLSKICDAAFFASLIEEEGQHPPFSLIYAGPTTKRIEEAGVDFHRFADQALSPAILRKLSSATKLGLRHLVVAGPSTNLRVAGLAAMPMRTWWEGADDFVRVCVPKPGTLVLEREGFVVLRYVGGTILRGPPIVLSRRQSVFPALQTVRSNLFDDVNEILADEALQRLAEGSERRAHGGLFLICADNTDLEDLLSSAKYRLNQPVDLGGSLARLVQLREDIQVADQQRVQFEGTKVVGHGAPGWEDLRRQGEYEAEHRRYLGLVDFLCDISTTDGAVVLDGRLRAHAFGVKVPTPKELPTVYRPVDTSATDLEVHDISTRGSRHKAAAAFPESHSRVALIVSQDGSAAICAQVGSRKRVFWKLRLSPSWVSW